MCESCEDVGAEANSESDAMRNTIVMHHILNLGVEMEKNAKIANISKAALTLTCIAFFSTSFSPDESILLSHAIASIFNDI